MFEFCSKITDLGHVNVNVFMLPLMKGCRLTRFDEVHRGTDVVVVSMGTSRFMQSSCLYRVLCMTTCGSLSQRAEQLKAHAL